MSDQAETKAVFVVWTNTDLTEGRGGQVPIAICETEATAKRLAKGKGLMGSNADVKEFEAIKYKNSWCGPFQIILATADDKLMQHLVDEHKAVIAKARSLDLSEEELTALCRGNP